MFAFCCRDMASPRSFYAIDDAISEKTRQAAAASMNFSQKSSWSMWKKTLKWGKSIAIIYVYIYISLAYYIYCTLLKKRENHSWSPSKKKGQSTIDHPLHKRVVPPEPIEATDMTVMRDNKEWKTIPRDVVLKKDWVWKMDFPFKYGDAWRKLSEFCWALCRMYSLTSFPRPCFWQYEMKLG